MCYLMSQKKGLVMLLWSLTCSEFQLQHTAWSAFILRPSLYYSVTHHLIFFLLFKAYMLLIIYASVALHKHVTNKLKVLWRAGYEAVVLVLCLLPSSFFFHPLCFALLFFLFLTLALLSVFLSDTDKLCLDVFGVRRGKLALGASRLFAAVSHTWRQTLSSLKVACSAMAVMAMAAWKSGHFWEQRSPEGRCEQTLIKVRPSTLLTRNQTKQAIKLKLGQDRWRVKYYQR